MSRRSALLRGSALVIQLVAAVAGLGAVALAPPASGRMLIVPLLHRDAAGGLVPALRAGAALIDQGPTAGSYVVIGDRDRLIGLLARHGALLLAAPAGGCGV